MFQYINSLKRVFNHKYHVVSTGSIYLASNEKRVIIFYLFEHKRLMYSCTCSQKWLFSPLIHAQYMSLWMEKDAICMRYVIMIYILCLMYGSLWTKWDIVNEICNNLHLVLFEYFLRNFFTQNISINLYTIMVWTLLHFFKITY